MDQCVAHDVPCHVGTSFDYEHATPELIIDAIFGFGFSGLPRNPFDHVLAWLKAQTCPVVAVDVPSGWDVDKGNIYNGYDPSLLISLSAPKFCSKDISNTCKHYVGGRFIPK